MNTSHASEKANTLKKPEGLKNEGFVGDFAKEIKTYSSTAVDSISEGYDTALAWAKKNPLQAAAVGAGIGFLLGTIVRRYVGRDKA